MGTQWYMAPEQARGEAVDRRADVYALGALLYHVLAGAPPYAEVADSDAVLAAAMSQPPLPLTSHLSVPSDLAAIVAKAMSPSPSERYAGATEFADDLKRFQTGQLVRSHSYSRAMDSVRSCLCSGGSTSQV